MYEDTPPLKIWAYSAGAAFTLLFLFLSYCYSGYSPYAEELAKGHIGLEAALKENNTKDTSAVSVVIIGSSLLERALVDPHEIEDIISKQIKKPTNFLRVSIYYMTMDLAERLNFFKYITKYPPKYLFIENFGINLDDGFGEALPTPVDAALLYLRNEFRIATGLPTHENYYNRWYTFDITPAPENDFYTCQFDSAAFKGFLFKKMVARKVSENETANNVYDALKGKTKIIFLGMPQSDKLHYHFLDKKDNEEFSGVMEYYKQHYNIDYWQYPGIMPDSCFSDGFHLNQRGAMKYQDWFVSKFASIK